MRYSSRSICVSGCRRPSGSLRPGSVTSSRSSASDRSSAACSRPRCLFSSAPSRFFFTSLARWPTCGRSSDDSLPSPLKTSINAELRPRCATRQASRAVSLWAESRASRAARWISFSCSSIIHLQTKKLPSNEGTGGIPVVPPNLTQWSTSPRLTVGSGPDYWPRKGCSPGRLGRELRSGSVRAGFSGCAPASLSASADLLSSVMAIERLDC